MLVIVLCVCWGARAAKGSVLCAVLLVAFIYFLFFKHAVTLFLGSLQEANSLGGSSASFLPGILFGNLFNDIVSDLAICIVAFL